jgi:hypothetical protein
VSCSLTTSNLKLHFLQSAFRCALLSKAFCVLCDTRYLTLKYEEALPSILMNRGAGAFSDLFRISMTRNRSLNLDLDAHISHMYNR